MHPGCDKDSVLPNETLERLAERLHATMERLEPTIDPDWTALTERQNDFYRFCIIEIMKTASALPSDLSSDKVGPTTTL
jgi:hypothetical protein